MAVGIQTEGSLRLWCRRQGKNELNEQSRMTKQHRQADQHPNTKGCKVSADLKDLVKTNNTLDEELLQFERQWKLTGVLSAEDITKSATIATSISDAIKAGRKKVSGLQSLFSMP